MFVSGRQQGGVDGFWVATPLTQGDSALYVVRGWVEDPDQAPPVPAAPAAITGWLQPTEGTGAVDSDRSDAVLPQMRTADLVQQVDRDLYGAYVVAQEPGPGLEPATLDQLPPVGAFTSVRNLLYAVEWWVFGAFAVFVWWRYVREEHATATASVAP